ncbi:MAG: trigger factor [Acidaminococcus sp.]|jgi:trigger factor|nr:trigger factor [Acidaminococcus sp.]MCI2100020.1 trigger factor [Acidaminococcus sp.]MCI2114300.1 trigger factor [Acidaminococcus sp.]MCI2116909.1 trigger factor [Acidaminococcus sp.]
MSVSVERNGNDATLKITLTTEEVAEGFKKAVARVNKQVTIPGFRKGKAPRRVLEIHVGKDAIKDEAFQILANGEYRKAIEENKLMPVADPELKEQKFEEGQPMEVTLLVTLRPEPELGEYKNLDVAKNVKKITDKDVDEALEALQKRAAKLVAAPEGKKLEKGDMATIDFTGTIDGKPFEGGEGKGYPLEIGSGAFIPGFEDQLIGVGKGESKDVNVTFPEDYMAKELAGKAAVFKVDVKDIKVREIPEVTDELVAANSDSKTVEEYRKKTAERMQKAEDDRAEEQYRRDLLNKAIENAKFEVPQVMVDQRANQMMDELAMNLEAHKMSLPMYLQYLGKDVKTYRDEQKPAALENIKTDLVLDAIAEKEGLKVSEEEAVAEMQQIADAQGATLRQVQKIIKDNNSVGILLSNILRRKAAQVIFDNAKGAEKKEETKTEETKTEEAKEDK